MTEYDCDPPTEVPPKLAPVITHLTERFAGTFAPETVARLVVDSYEKLAVGAVVDTYLPVLTQHLAADRLCATASAEGKM